MGFFRWISILLFSSLDFSGQPKGKPYFNSLHFLEAHRNLTSFASSTFKIYSMKYKCTLTDTLHLFPITWYIFNPSVFSSSAAIFLRNETLHLFISAGLLLILSGNSLACKQNQLEKVIIKICHNIKKFTQFTFWISFQKTGKHRFEYYELISSLQHI